MQPFCEQQQPDQGPAQPEQVELAPFVWLFILIVVIAFDVWALTHGQQTLSQWTQRLRPWLRVLGAVAFAFLAWHLFLGFPWRLHH